MTGDAFHKPAQALNRAVPLAAVDEQSLIADLRPLRTVRYDTIVVGAGMAGWELYTGRTIS